MIPCADKTHGQSQEWPLQSDFNEIIIKERCSHWAKMHIILWGSGFLICNFKISNNFSLMCKSLLSKLESLLSDRWRTCAFPPPPCVYQAAPWATCPHGDTWQCRPVHLFLEHHQGPGVYGSSVIRQHRATAACLSGVCYLPKNDSPHINSQEAFIIEPHSADTHSACKWMGGLISMNTCITLFHRPTIETVSATFSTLCNILNLLCL